MKALKLIHDARIVNELQGQIAGAPDLRLI